MTSEEALRKVMEARLGIVGWAPPPQILADLAELGFVLVNIREELDADGLGADFDPEAEQQRIAAQPPAGAVAKRRNG